MAARKRSPVENYHDRVAGLYDTIYDGDPYWEVVFQLTWRHILRHLPKNQSARCLDVGCGTGRWGLRLAKAGYRVDFLDISQKMLDQTAVKLTRLGRSCCPAECLSGADAAGAAAREGESAAAENENTGEKGEPADRQAAILWHTSIDDLSRLPSGGYDFIVGQGDPLSCAEKPGRAFKELARLMAPGGVIVLSVDNRLQGMYHYFKDGDVPGLEAFLRTGRTNWVTDRPEERYPMTMFTPGQLRAMCRERGLEVLSLIGKTVLPLRRFKELLADPAKRETLLRLEESLQATEALLANAAHLDFAARKG